MAYNRSKGREPLDISEVLEPLHACLRELLESDRQGKSHLIEYTDKDIAAATLIYAHVLGNRLAHNMMREKVSQGMSQHLATSYGGMIHSLTKSMAGIDINVIFNGKGKGQ